MMGPPRPAPTGVEEATRARPAAAERRQRRRRPGWWLSGLCAAVLALPASAADPWYADLAGHWAEDEVHVLWEEGTTDGYRLSDALGRQNWYFLPNQFIERAQYAVMLTKVLGLSPGGGPPAYADVPPGYRAGGDLEAYPWIQAGAAAGIFPPEPGGRFRPADVTRRDEAVAMLIRALELEWYADSLDPARVDALLAAYRDAASIRPALRRAMAAAIDLAIVVGYGDGYLRPDRSLTRAEAATLLYKSALMRVGADPPSFSPDHDGHEDQTRISGQALLNQNQAGWRVDILAGDGRTVRRWTGDRLPAAWFWDGRDENGAPVPAGLYLLRGSLFTRQGRHFHSAVEPLEVVYQRLQAWVSPLAAYPGEAVTLQALTEGPAAAVEAEDERGLRRALAPGGAGVWQVLWTVPGDASPGAYRLRVEARFPAARRVAEVTVEVLPRLWVEARVEPNPARPGTSVRILAETPPGVEEVVVQRPGATGELPLTEGRTGTWATTWTVPAGSPPGPMPLEVVASRGGHQARDQVVLQIEQTGSAPEPIFFLSR